MNPTRRSILAVLPVIPLAGLAAAMIGPAPLAAGGRIAAVPGGVFGYEHGPECWIPISRDSAGRLGVKVNSYAFDSQYRLHSKEFIVSRRNRKSESA